MHKLISQTLAIINPLYSAALQAPTISVFPFQGISVEAGGQDTITCTATFDEGLVQRPTPVWEFPGLSTADTTMGDQLENRGTTSKTLTFNHIHISQAGVYTCRATIDLQGIDSRSWTASLVVRVQSELSVHVLQNHRMSIIPHHYKQQ